MSKRRNIGKTSTKHIAILFGVTTAIAAGALVEACGLDDSVAIQGGGPGGSADATIGADGNGASGDGGFTVDGGRPLLPDGAVDPGDDAAVALDAGDAAALPDATASDGGACPSGKAQCGVGASATCVTDCTAQCTGSSLSCTKEGVATCVADCTTCGASSAQCYRCESGTNFQASGTCEDPNASSSCIKDGNYLHCACFGYNVGNCPGATQVCRPTLIPGVGVCKTCGESNSKGQSCHVGGKCDTGNDTCH